MGKPPPSPLALAPLRTALSTATLRCATTRISAQQVRCATFIPRACRPYTFTQLIQLSDGSTYTMRTTSPTPIYSPAKDSRNSLLWQPSEKSLRNVELDEAGKLAAFRKRFGHDFDLATEEKDDADKDEDTGLAGLISGYMTTQNAGAMNNSKKLPTKKK